MTDTENTFGGFTLLDDEEEFDELCLLLCGFQFAQLIGPVDKCKKLPNPAVVPAE